MTSIPPERIAQIEARREELQTAMSAPDLASAPSAMAIAERSETAPSSSRISCGTPSISCFAALV